jgi:hypothetical protein
MNHTNIYYNKLQIKSSQNSKRDSVVLQHKKLFLVDSVTDLVNTLTVNSSVNTVQHATIEEAVLVSCIHCRGNAW